MKQVLIFTFTFWAMAQAMAQEQIRYIKTSEPVIETAAPSRDGNSVYHFFYTFNWSNDSSTYSNKLNPVIDELEIYEFGAKVPFKIINAPNDSKNQVEFEVRKSEIDKFNQIQYAVKWEISSPAGQRLINVTNRRTLNLNFVNDPKLIVSISDERIFYTDDINKPRIKIKTNHDGVSIENLVLRLQQKPDAEVVAEVKNNITKINSNMFSELVFEPTGLVDLKEGKSYYLYGNFKTSTLSAPIPLPKTSNNAYQIYKKEQYSIKPLINEGKVIKVQGNSTIERVFDATGEISNIKASLKLGSNGNREYPMFPQGSDRWKLTIPGDPLIPYGTYNLEFEGTGKNGEPLKPTTFSYTKSQIKRKIIQMEVKDNVYEATAEFTETPSGNVYLVIDGIDVQMKQLPSNTKSYSVNFSYDDKTLQQLSEAIKNQPNNQKRVLITTKVEEALDESYTAKNATVIDVKELEGKGKNEIKDYLKESGFEANINELTKNISAELKKNKSERNWGTNVWSSLVEWAPKAIPLVLMAL